METTFKDTSKRFYSEYLLEVSRHFTQQQIHIFNELVELCVKHLENPDNYAETCKQWDACVEQLDDKVKMAIVCRAGQEAIELFEEIGK
jgi:hypothetical protein